VLEGDYVRRGAAEFVGTFALIFVGAGSVAFARTLTDIALAHGLVIAVFVSALGFISGGHFNPAITLGFLITRRIATTLALVYWLVQFGAAALAALTLKLVLPNAIETQSSLGAPSLGGGIGPSAGVVVEAIRPRKMGQQSSATDIGSLLAFACQMAGRCGGIPRATRAAAARFLRIPCRRVR